MRWKSSRISASVYFGAFRSRLRSLWTQQRCTVALGQTNSTARRNPALPSMIASSGVRNPRATNRRGTFRAGCSATR